jgi:ATP-dependent DNA helicase RecG
MSATPIPRSLAMTVYGDLDISSIDELPPGRKEIHTYLVSEEERSAVYDFIREEVKLGRQAYIVYPLIEESTTPHLKAAAKMAEHLKTNIFPEFRVGLLHGQMKDKEKVMQSFKKGEIDILISTTVIEVGVDVPNASIMVVENAERFGLAQLHQMRGRIGRGDYESFCILMGEPGSEEARRRLEVLAQTSDGFQIAEEDLELRGPGEFFGTRQHGMPELRIANISSDMKLLEIAREEAFSILSQRPGLAEPKYKNLKMLLQAKYRPQTKQ